MRILAILVILAIFVSCGDDSKKKDDNTDIEKKTGIIWLNELAWLNKYALPGSEEVSFKFDEAVSKGMKKLKVGIETKDIAIITQLKKLEYLSLSKSSVSSLEPLKDFSSLRFLLINNVKFTDISALDEKRENPLYVLYDSSKNDFDKPGSGSIVMFDSNDPCDLANFQALLFDKYSHDEITLMRKGDMAPVFKAGDPNNEVVGVVMCDELRK